MAIEEDFKIWVNIIAAVYPYTIYRGAKSRHKTVFAKSWFLTLRLFKELGHAVAKNTMAKARLQDISTDATSHWLRKSIAALTEIFDQTRRSAALRRDNQSSERTTRRTIFWIFQKVS